MTTHVAAVIASFIVLSPLGFAGEAPPEEPTIRVVAGNLKRPTGIALRGRTIYFTQVPTPGIAGGENSVDKLSLESAVITNLHKGEPEPTFIAVDQKGSIYWTCKSAGVILEQNRKGETVVLLENLSKPGGIAVDHCGRVYFTEIPSPGVAGANNRVSVLQHQTTTILHMGEPEPTEIVVSKHGDIYWTCKSAGVILEQNRKGETTVLLKDLAKPVGIALDRSGRRLYWTEVPTPGVSGNNGGKNTVNVLNLKTLEHRVIHAGDPEPTGIAVAANGNVYWTCTSAGVIVEASWASSREESKEE